MARNIGSGGPICSRMRTGQMPARVALTHPQRKLYPLVTSNRRLARATWGSMSGIALKILTNLTKEYGFSVSAGDLQLLDGRWYVTHSGLLRLASRRGCRGIDTCLLQRASDPMVGRWVFRAKIYKSGSSKGFVGYGDADPSNVSPLVRGAELRVAETRAVNRALRKAYGIGLCSVEELGSLSGSFNAAREPKRVVKQPPENGSNNGQPRLRDKLCLLIREHNLNPNLVKAYAADFCGTQALRDANRDQIEAFISQLSKEAKESRDGLVCKLNSYVQPQEVTS
jgi:hypothetical protein